MSVAILRNTKKPIDIFLLLLYNKFIGDEHHENGFKFRKKHNRT